MDFIPVVTPLRYVSIELLEKQKRTSLGLSSPD